MINTYRVLSQSIILSLLMSTALKSEENPDIYTNLNKAFEVSKDIILCDTTGNIVKSFIFECISIPPYRVLKSYDGFRGFIVTSDGEPLEILKIKEDIMGNVTVLPLINGPWENDIKDSIRIYLDKSESNNSQKEKAINAYENYYKDSSP